MKKINLENLQTETRNQNSTKLDTLSSGEILALINQEDALIAQAIQQQLPAIDQAVNLILETHQNQGRIFYLGAGSSGRIGVLDASEMLPTYGVDNLFYGIIAGGDQALRNPIEGAEDETEFGVNDLKAVNFSKKDLVFVIGASGRTPYCIGALQYAQNIGAKTIALSMSPNSTFGQIADVNLEVIVGPEIVTGSTRMKAGTATKMVLNMISTTTMIKLNKVYDNLMIDVQPTNKKLVQRAFNIVQAISGADEILIWETLAKADYQVKPTIVMLDKKVDYHQALAILEQEPNLRVILEQK